MINDRVDMRAELGNGEKRKTSWPSRRAESIHQQELATCHVGETGPLNQHF